MICDLRSELKKNDILPGVLPTSDYRFDQHISGRYGGDEDNYIDETSPDFIEKVKPLQPQLTFFACIDVLLKLKLHADTLSTKNSYFFAKVNKFEADAINGLLSKLDHCITLNQAKAAIREKYNKMYKTFPGIISFSNSATGKLMIALEKNLDRPELRPLRRHAEELASLIGDKKATERAKALHKLLDKLLDETQASKIVRQLIAASRSATYTTHRNIFHYGDTKTVQLLQAAIQSVYKNKTAGLYPNQEITEATRQLAAFRQ